MPAFALWLFPHPDGATRAETVVSRATADAELTLDDAIVLDWPGGRPSPGYARVFSVVLTAPRRNEVWADLLEGIAGGAGRERCDAESVQPELPHSVTRELFRRFHPGYAGLLLIGDEETLRLLVAEVERGAGPMASGGAWG